MYLRKLTKAFTLLACLALTACGGSGGTRSPNNQNGTPPATQGATRAILGPIVDATAEAVLASDTATLIETATTSNTTDIDTAGSFELLLDGIDDDAFVLVTISGGADIDANDDGTLDTTPTANNGQIRGLARAADWREGLNITLLSETVVQAVTGSDISQLEAMDPATIEAQLTAAATTLLDPSADPNNDGVSDFKDLFEYVPSQPGFPVQASAEELSTAAQAILSGADDAEREAALALLADGIEVDAGTDQSVDGGSTVELDGSVEHSLSEDPDLSWEQIQGPPVMLSSTTTLTPEFVAPNADAILIFELSASVDGNPPSKDQVTITTAFVAPANNPPTVNAGPDQTVDEGTVVNLAGTATDSDGTIANVSWQQIAGSNVALSNAAANNTSFTAPAVDAAGEVLTFRFSATDNAGVTSNDTVSITVSDVPVVVPNQPPTAVSIDVSTDENTPVGIALQASDTDGTITGYTIVATTVNGTLTGAPPNLTYTPDQDFSGTDSFTFTATDNDGATSNIANVSITVIANEAPVAVAQTVTTDENEPVDITLQGTDADGSVASFSVTSGPTNGTLSGTAPDLTYTPDTGFSGADSFTFTVTDNDGKTSTAATVSITVTSNEAPEATTASVTTEEDLPVNIALQGTDADGTVVDYTVTANPTNGTLSGTPPALTYTPADNFSGEDAFSFTVTDDDGATSTAAIVNITVTPVVDLPVAHAGPDQLVDNGAAVTLDGSASTEGDAPIDTYTWTQTSGPAVNLTGADQVMPTFTAPTTENPDGLRLEFQLEIADTDGVTDKDLVAIVVFAQLPTTSFTLNANPDFPSKGVSPDGRLTIFAPGGAVATDTEVTIKRLTAAETEAIQVAPGDLPAIYEFAPADLDLLAPLEIFWSVPDGSDTANSSRFILGLDGNNEGTVLQEQAVSSSTSTTKASTTKLPNKVIAPPGGLSIVTTIDNGVYADKRIILNVGETKQLTTTFRSASSDIDDFNLDPMLGTASGTEQVISVSEPSRFPIGDEYRLFTTVTCNAKGSEDLLIQASYREEMLVAQIGLNLDVDSGTIRERITVVCESATPLIVEIPAGTGPEGVRVSPGPFFSDPLPPISPITQGPGPGLAVSQSEMVLFDPATGVIIDTGTPSSGQTTFGALPLTPNSDDPDYAYTWFAAITNGQLQVFPFEPGFGFSSPPFPGRFTSDIKFDRDANGNRLANQAIIVQSEDVKRLQQTAPTGSFSSSLEDIFTETELINQIGTGGVSGGDGIFTCDPLSRTQLMCATTNGRIVHIDSLNRNATLIADNAGPGVRDIMCTESLVPGQYTCGVQSFDDAQLTFCSGSTVEDFSCAASPTPAGDGVSIGAATTLDGNALFSSVSFANGSLHLIEVNPDDLSIIRNIVISNAQINTMADPGVISNPGHCEIDPETNQVFITGNSSDNMLGLPFEIISQSIEVSAPDDSAAMQEWFRSPLTIP